MKAAPAIASVGPDPSTTVPAEKAALASASQARAAPSRYNTLVPAVSLVAYAKSGGDIESGVKQSSPKQTTRSKCSARLVRSEHSCKTTQAKGEAGAARPIRRPSVSIQFRRSVGNPPRHHAAIEAMDHSEGLADKRIAAGKVGGEGGFRRGGRERPGRRKVDRPFCL